MPCGTFKSSRFIPVAKILLLGVVRCSRVYPLNHWEFDLFPLQVPLIQMGLILLQFTSLSNGILASVSFGDLKFRNLLHETAHGVLRIVALKGFLKESTRKHSWKVVTKPLPTNLKQWRVHHLRRKTIPLSNNSNDHEAVAEMLPSLSLRKCLHESYYL